MSYPVIVARQQLGGQVPVATNTRNNRRIVGAVVLCAVRVVSNESLWVCLCIPLIVARQRLSKHVPTATKNSWSRRFVCGPCRIKGK
jgi:hypothetical protein